VILCGGIALAQEQAGAGKARAAVTAVGERPGNLIIGQPYSATIETEVVQTLADGTHITRKGIGRKEYRDSQGRTRIEYYTLRASGEGEQTLTSVIIRDPVAGTWYVLNPRDHTVRQTIPDPAPPLQASTGTNRPEGAAGVQPAGPHEGSGPPASSSSDERKPPTMEDLGTETMEGLVVEGTRITRVIPVGVMGNDQPIAIVTERWFSQELGISILVKNSDPRQGESTLRTTDIDRSEPDSALFQVPADYTMGPPR
jgi:hypothetical protein